jgi:HrpA-like RNA helicase
MRMGHGVRDETSETKIWFVTTGYLVRLLAYNPAAFDSHTHLIIDEVHERSVDGDLLCLLAKKLLTRNKSLHLVLMSATMHIKLYQSYFSDGPEYYGSLDCLSVGARRFPLQIFYANDMSTQSSLPSVFRALSDKVAGATAKQRARDTPNAEMVKNQYKLAYNIIREVVESGTGVLVFVSGIHDIVEISELFVDQEKYVVVPIHSDIPFEEQEAAFQPVEANKIKVVIATNAAESSITLPDVDVVICLGTHKVVEYDHATNRVALVNRYISKASAAQRAGRTGRTRPGTVYRLYSSVLYESLNEHDPAEVERCASLLILHCGKP